MFVFGLRHYYKGGDCLEGTRLMLVSKAQIFGWLLGRGDICGCDKYVISGRGLMKEGVLRGAIRQVCAAGDRAAIQTLSSAMMNLLSSSTVSMEMKSRVCGLDIFVNRQEVVNLEKLRLNGKASCDGGGCIGTRRHEEWIEGIDFYGDTIIPKVKHVPRNDSSRIEFRYHVD